MLVRWITSWARRAAGAALPASGSAKRTGAGTAILASYTAARSALARNDLQARTVLSRSAQTPPEMLYFLASDEDEGVREGVATNAATPTKALLQLADDSASSVRGELARRLVRLMPDLKTGQVSQQRDETIAMVEALARDEAPRVRRLLAEEIARLPHAPPGVIRTLAHDAITGVAAPILEFSPLLQDEDLIEIIAASRAQGALTTIARRASVSEPVSDDIVASLEIPAIAALLANPRARIREETMERIVDQAETTQALHEPLVMRTDLSVRTIRRVADFVGASLLDRLIAREGLDEDTADLLRARLRQRMIAETSSQGASGVSQKTQAARAQVAAAAAKGRLTPDFVADLSAEGDRAGVAAALASLAGAPIATVEKILGSASAKAVTALCWRAGLPMRQAVAIQREIARVPHGEVLLARQGRDYPLPPEAMIWHLEFFGIAPP